MGVNPIKKKSYLISLLLVFIIIASSFYGDNMLNFAGVDGAYKIASAAPKASSGGFKSGSFKSSTPKTSVPKTSTPKSSTSKPSGWSNNSSTKSSTSTSKSSSGGFKSGSFSNTPAGNKNKSSSSTSNNSSSSSKKTYDSNYDRPKSSWFPIPIPIPWGNRSNSQGSFLGRNITAPFNIMSSIIKFIIFIIILIFIINIIKNIIRRK